MIVFNVTRIPVLYDRGKTVFEHTVFRVPVKLRFDGPFYSALLDTNVAVSLIPIEMKEDVEILKEVGSISLGGFTSNHPEERFSLYKIALYFSDNDFSGLTRLEMLAAIPMKRKTRVAFSIGLAGFSDKYRISLDVPNNRGYATAL